MDRRKILLSVVSEHDAVRRQMLQTRLEQLGYTVSTGWHSESLTLLVLVARPRGNLYVSFLVTDPEGLTAHEVDEYVRAVHYAFEAYDKDRAVLAAA